MNARFCAHSSACICLAVSLFGILVLVAFAKNSPVTPLPLQEGGVGAGALFSVSGRVSKISHSNNSYSFLACEGNGCAVVRLPAGVLAETRSFDAARIALGDFVRAEGVLQKSGNLSMITPLRPGAFEIIAKNARGNPGD